MFNSFIKPYVDYRTLVWGGATKSHLIKIDKSIKKSMHVMQFKGKYGLIKPFYEYLKILPLSENIKLLQGKFMWKLLNNCRPSCIKKQFPVTFSNAINSTDCRLIIPCFRTGLLNLRPAGRVQTYLLYSTAKL